VSRRQLERNFAHWIGTSPRHLAQVARLQSVSRHARSGGGLADVAAASGYADQAHMTRAVRQLTGLTPRQFVQSMRAPWAEAFSAVTGGGTIYL
jgi:AraC-like DNA-binding protein